MKCLTDSGSSSQSQPTEAGLLICLTVPDFAFVFVVLCRRSAPLPVAYMYIECAHYPQIYAPRRLYEKGILAL